MTIKKWAKDTTESSQKYMCAMAREEMKIRTWKYYLLGKYKVKPHEDTITNFLEC